MTIARSAIRTVDLTKSFSRGLWHRPSTVLDHVNLDVRPGELFGLLGPNGAGKTTTFRILLDLIRPSSGQAWIFDRPAGDWEGRKRVGYQPEAPTLYDHLTAEGCLTFFGRLCDLGGAELHRRVEELLDLIGLREARARRLRTFSKGMLQRVAIAQALIHDPDLLLLDEPMSGLDPIGRRELRVVLLLLKQAGKTIVMSSHVLHDVERLCDRVAILHHGRVATVMAIDAMDCRQDSEQELAGVGASRAQIDRVDPLSLEARYCQVVGGRTGDPVCEG